jgi:hypothetical protein
MTEPLVVLTYPGHFLLTALTIQSYFQHHNKVETVIIIDDLSKHAWDSYQQDCELLYQQPVIVASRLSFLSSATDGWMRQQMLKYHLDLLVPYPNWFFTDGDINFRFPAPCNQVPFSITRGTELMARQNAYVQYMLGIKQAGIYTQHPDMDWDPTTKVHQVCVSNPPFRSMRADDLIKFREHVERTHDRPFADFVMGMKYDSVMSMSEWEALANFQVRILLQPPDLVYYPSCPQGHVKSHASDPDFCEHYFKTDSELGRDWFRNQGISVSDQIWHKLDNISK